ncbi:hypothetical protein H696_02594 [Fonticula alba]|uniref:PRELI/MSF1 domain-containing protein n=1 Tax=Fonticula alba TaxID=691883 RepID=A0A058Z7I5_FONAL|nr:hypothetical protein H696_02594 [Fonticula alba]KCV70264.1 hypothetical protein H696_02594 [Fonticula alba]|eukprot:XP_009494780.1 hypothetical protein H696_02594 [Fonticula alba]
MVRVLEIKTVIEHPWHIVALAFFNKYTPGNPHVAHIQAYDILRRVYDGQRGILSTTRLALKNGKIPAWGRSFMPKAQAYVVEASQVDRNQRTMTTITHNLTHKTLMNVEERQTFSVHPENPNWTVVSTEAHISSGIGYGLSGRVEAFGYSSFQRSAERARQALAHTILNHFNTATETAETAAMFAPSGGAKTSPAAAAASSSLASPSS